MSVFLAKLVSTESIFVRERIISAAVVNLFFSFIEGNKPMSFFEESLIHNIWSRGTFYVTRIVEVIVINKIKKGGAWLSSMPTIIGQ